MKKNFLKKLLILFFITMTGVFANENSVKKTKTVKVLNVDVKISIEEVKHTFFEALILVILIIYMFLGNLRSTIIPILAVPVSICGAFIGIYAFGFSINLITLFSLVLAIGIVVDDAIIVIENVERILHEERNLSVKEATIKAMDEIQTPVISIVLVLSAVFVPVAFMDGFVGVMQRQFALTLVSSVIFSGFVALTLTPALCAMVLKKKEAEPFWFVRKFFSMLCKLLFPIFCPP